MNLNFCGASDSFFYQWCPNLEEAEDAARYCAIILSRWVGVAGGDGAAMQWNCKMKWPNGRRDDIYSLDEVQAGAA